LQVSLVPHFTRGRVGNIFFTWGRVVSKRGASRRRRVGEGELAVGRVDLDSVL
jgi:hypothetical protein